MQMLLAFDLPRVCTSIYQHSVVRPNEIYDGKNTRIRMKEM